jgi:hypothetical protein
VIVVKGFNPKDRDRKNSPWPIRQACLNTEGRKGELPAIGFSGLKGAKVRREIASPNQGVGVGSQKRALQCSVKLS